MDRRLRVAVRQGGGFFRYPQHPRGSTQAGDVRGFGEFLDQVSCHLSLERRMRKKKKKSFSTVQLCVACCLVYT